MAKKVLFVQGGTEGHHPLPISQRFARLMEKEGFETEITGSLDALLDLEKLKALNLIFYTWTMGTITRAQLDNVLEAIASGVGLAGCHGGLCDALRLEVDWQFMTGGQWVSHPGGDMVTFDVNIKKNADSPIIEGLEDFKVTSEQYYMQIDPAVNVLATTRFPTVDDYHTTNGVVDVPVTWTKMWGYGRVFYTSIGHHVDIFDIPQAEAMMLRGMLWAAEGKDIAAERGLDYRKLRKA